MKPTHLARASIVLAVTLGASGITAAAATDRLDLSVGLKTLPLLTSKIASPAVVAIVFDPASATSIADADAIKRFFDNGLEGPGGMTLNVVLTRASDLGTVDRAKIIIVATGVGKSALDAVAAASVATGALSMSTDLDCVKAHKCVLGVVSQPNVEIYFSRLAAEAANVEFAPAFTMLARPIR